MKTRKSIFIISVLLLVFCCYFLKSFYSKSMITTNKENISFVIESGNSLHEIATKLKKENIIFSKELFLFYAKYKSLDTKIQPGSYIISPSTPVKNLLAYFQNPASKYVKVTIPEGFSFYQIATTLEELNIVNKQAFLSLSSKDLNSPVNQPNNKEIPYPLEGFLFPETYFFSLNTDPIEIAKAMHFPLSKIFTQQYIEQAKKLGYSLQEILTIASLIEKEATNDEERKKIAGVIYNRLKIKMPLQIDATVIYATTKGHSNIEKLYYKHLEISSPYNTYISKALPPGPIASPGRSSIEAALYPETHNYLYYVLGENGHVFSKTYEEHMDNVNKYIQ